MRPLFLIEYALDAVQNAYAPYSNFSVGAALLASDGQVFTGCNIENAAYPSTICAERVAFFKAISAGVRKFDAIALVAKDKNGFVKKCFPCGSCLQVMAEFCEPNFLLYLGNDKKSYEAYTLEELLPNSFHL